MLARRRCHVVIGRHTLHLPETFGVSTRLERASLSRPRSGHGVGLGAFRGDWTGAFAHGLIWDCTATLSRRGILGSPIADAYPCRERPPVCAPRDGCGGAGVDVPGRRVWLDVGTIGHLFCLGQGGVACLGGEHAFGGDGGGIMVWCGTARSSQVRNGSAWHGRERAGSGGSHMDQAGALLTVGLLFLIFFAGVGAILGVWIINSRGIKAAARTAAIACLVIAALTVLDNIVNFLSFQGPLEVPANVLVLALYIGGFLTVGFAGVVLLQSSVIGMRWVTKSALDAAFHRKR